MLSTNLEAKNIWFFFSERTERCLVRTVVSRVTTGHASPVLPYYGPKKKGNISHNCTIQNFVRSILANFYPDVGSDVKIFQFLSGLTTGPIKITKNPRGTAREFIFFFQLSLANVIRHMYPNKVIIQQALGHSSFSWTSQAVQTHFWGICLSPIHKN